MADTISSTVLPTVSVVFTKSKFPDAFSAITAACVKDGIAIPLLAITEDPSSTDKPTRDVSGINSIFPVTVSAIIAHFVKFGTFFDRNVVILQL